MCSCSSALDGLHDVNYPNMKLLGILFVIFVLLVGPGLYLLLGNLAAFAPMGVFLPCLFRRQGNLLFFLPTMTLMIASVEVIQVLEACGSGDIDDLILNLTGAFAFWLIFWPVTRHVNHLLRGNKA